MNKQTSKTGCWSEVCVYTQYIHAYACVDSQRPFLFRHRGPKAMGSEYGPGRRIWNSCLHNNTHIQIGAHASE